MNEIAKKQKQNQKQKTNKQTNKQKQISKRQIKPNIDLRQPGFKYSACRPFTKNKERIKNLKRQEIQDIFIKKTR